jgi:hypothetical protein
MEPLRHEQSFVTVPQLRLVRQRTAIALMHAASPCESLDMPDDLSTRYTDAVLRIETMLSPFDDAYTVHGATALRDELNMRGPFLEQAGMACARGTMRMAAAELHVQSTALLAALDTALRTYKSQDQLMVIAQAKRWRMVLNDHRQAIGLSS